MTNKFQSLSGFQVHCNVAEPLACVVPNRVSIPIGFSSALQCPPELDVITNRIGFNPYRVFKCIAILIESRILLFISMFQSLSGFQVHCNHATELLQDVQRCSVSIPIGFSSALQLRHHEWVSIGGFRFQSLSGFQVHCNLFGPSYRQDRCYRFNPYRVFKCIAMPIRMRPRTRILMFQSLSGFQVHCNRLEPFGRFRRYDVSIPIGFSSALQCRRVWNASS